jgi:hypothetical protein
MKYKYSLYILKRGEGGLHFRHYISNEFYTEEDLIIEKLKNPDILYIKFPLEDNEEL